MKRIAGYLLVAYFIGNTLYSCKKEIAPVYEEKPPATFADVFYLFWNKMNTHYNFWDIDTTNWDNMYSTYKPLFEQLNLAHENDQKKAVQYFRQMTSGLVDGHYYLTFNNDLLKDSIINPAYDRKRKTPDFHQPFPYFGVDKDYFDAGYMTGYDSTTDRGQLLFASCATIQHNILYFNCNYFMLSRSYQAPGNNGVKPVLQHFFEQLQNTAAFKGVIIDLRGNRGGDVSDLDFLMGRFIEAPFHIGYSRYKNGNGRLDFTPWIKTFVHPQATGKTISTPIIALVDNFSASLAEIVALTIHAMPHGTVVGERTWGATGPLIANMHYNAGEFEVGTFLSVKTSSAAFKYLDNKSYEQTGFMPINYIPFNREALNNGHDMPLEKAISLLR